MKTAVQELFSKLEKEHPNLFNVHSIDGREFINSYYYILEMEKKQIKNAFYKGIQEQQQTELSKGLYFQKTPDDYYRETFKPETTN